MKKDKPTNQSNSQQQEGANSKLKKQYSEQPKEEFRQQESTVGKVDKTLNTGGQQQLNQTTAVLDRPVNDDRNSSSNDSKLKKQYSNQPKEEFRQQESTVSKIEKNLETSGQQQLNQTSNVLNGSANNQNSSSNGSKLKKQYSNQPKEEFRQQESTASKIEKTLDTSGQQQLNQASNVLNGSANNQNSSSNGSKLKKQYSNQPKEEFRQQESTTGKIDKTLNKSGQKQLNKTSNVLNGSANNQNSSSNKGKLKRFTKDAFKSGANGTKKAVTKYQKELEKDDQGVKVASKGVTGTVRTKKVTAKVYRKLRQKKGTSVKTFVIQQSKNTKSKNTKSKSTVLAKPRKLKLKRKVLNNKNLKKARINPLSKEKPKVSSLKKITKIPAVSLKKGTLKYQKELEKGDDGVKLVSQGATATARVRKKLLTGKSKVSAKSGRLNKQSTKLLKSNLNKNKKLQVQSKTALKKRAIKKKLYYAPQRNRVKAFKGAMSSFSNRISHMFKNFGKFKLGDIKRFIGAKIAAVAGGGLLTVLPLIIVAVLCLIIAGLVAGVGSKKAHDEMQMGSDSVSPEVRKWCPLITKEAQAQGMEAYVDLLASIIQVESGGKGTRDIMQSSESAGYPVNYWPTEELSIRQGIKHLKNIVNILQGFGSGYESNTKLLAQAYNFGSAFAGYVGRQGGSYTLEVAEAYSRDVVAPSLGNHTGATVPYINDTSVRLGKPYRYVNGGNFLYGELVGQYGGCSSGGGGAANITGDFAIVLKEIEKYKGWPYSWGGKSPKTGFDCSGLTSWGLKQIGINLPSYAQTQYNMTVPISTAEAQPGDLIFFKGTYGGPNHISHVGFYIDENTMYDSNGSGIGYHNWKDKYWQAHFAGIRRVVTK
ncbi:bifunctional lytic transglycosylase/C40 family peptidase [Lysinibacillus xylanilyticus]|uniref:bifunctional lytic transglycosylase/C40 family peptidase n=1 Tax=Lysinibacillus xylanilyticus TaxID=582475 RepID=UPI002E24AC4A|nr:bifunctional lytic transglycosylase/C40 family peptidase [Lysinibacillus xylanilyticus]